jgi:hypothetical protein
MLIAVFKLECLLEMQDACQEWVDKRRHEEKVLWAVAVVKRAWRRYVMRRRLRRYMRLRRQMQHIIMRPYFFGWRKHALAESWGNAARQKACFFAWRGYCHDLWHLHKRIIAWGWSTVQTMGGMHLTWQLCTPPAQDGVDSGTCCTSLLACICNRSVDPASL